MKTPITLMTPPFSGNVISTLKEVILDGRLLGAFVINTKAGDKARYTAAAIAEEVLTRDLASAASATLRKLNDGLNLVSAEIANIRAQELPEARNAEMMLALTGGVEAIDKLSVTTSARSARQQALKEVLDYGYKVARPTVNLASLKASAEWATAEAEVAACVALESAGEAYQAGAALREVEGRGELFPAQGKTANLLETARRLFGIANDCSIAYSNEARRLEKEQK